MSYCIDTSTFLDAWDRWYPIDVFPSLWTSVEKLIEVGTIISSEEVLFELERKDDALYNWAKEHSDVFLPLSDEVQARATQIMADFPKFVDERTGKSFGDPFVIGTAMVHGATVVTGEKGGSMNRPTIPIVCDHYKVRCLNTVEFLRAVKFRF